VVVLLSGGSASSNFVLECNLPLGLFIFVCNTKCFSETSRSSCWIFIFPIPFLSHTSLMLLTIYAMWSISYITWYSSILNSKILIEYANICLMICFHRCLSLRCLLKLYQMLTSFDKKNP
jgi:hypothetical protein